MGPDNSARLPKRARVETELEKLLQEVERPSDGVRQLLRDGARPELVFMQVDSNQEFVVDSSDCAVIRMFGIMEDGASVLARVTGYHPSFYVQASQRGGQGQSCSTAQICNALERKAQATTRNPCKRIVLNVETVKRRSILHYVPGDPELDFFKITVALPKHVKELGNLFERGIEVGNGFQLSTQTFDVGVDFLLRFMIEAGLVGCSWLALPEKSYRVNRNINKLQLEVEVHYSEIRPHNPVGEWLKIAPLRRLSFDIECAGRKGVFPEPEKDSVIQIANYVTIHGANEEATNTNSKVIFTLKSCAAIAGARILSFEDEAAMLSAWSSYIRSVDPDVLSGYNIVNFDLPFLLTRAKTLGASDFPFLGRISRSVTTMRDTKMSSSAFGTHESKEFTIDGRVVMDMLQVITRDYKLRSYSLNSVSAEFLGEQKEDVHYSIISDLQAGNEQTRRRLAVYCLKDAVLPQRLMDKLMSLTNYMEMARVTGIPLGWLFQRGHMVKVVSLLHRKAREVDLVIPDLARGSAGGRPDGDGPAFEGATVIEPKTGYYQDPIATLDFASLYPSIIMANNLCYSTLVQPQDIDKLQVEDYVQTPNGDYFVKSEVKKGLLSTILEELLGARKKAKADLKAATDPFVRGVLDGRQLALKISANAVYGFTGATVGKLPCMAISASTTSYGRQMIEHTREQVEGKYPGSTVIYGDTDSVMIRFGKGFDLAKCMDLGEKAATEITKHFPHPVRLEFEKCYFPYLLISKKRYAGLYWTNTKAADKMDCKGIESVRRDNCRLVANVISRVLEFLLQKRDLPGAIAFVKSTISDLLQNRIDISLLVVSKALTKTEGNYDAKQAHGVLAEKMRQRDPGTAPSLGDRVPYVITRGAKNAAAYERAEDPLYALEHNVPIDNNYYLENMLRKPLERIFEPMMKSTSELFSGDHTRSIIVATPKTGGIMAFAAVTLTCLGCRTPIEKGPLCKFCTKKEDAIYLKHLLTVQEYEDQYAALWTECQNCMGDVCQDVLCSNSDCPIFYRRRKVQKELETATAKLGRFKLDW